MTRPAEDLASDLERAKATLDVDQVDPDRLQEALDLCTRVDAQASRLRDESRGLARQIIVKLATAGVDYRLFYGRPFSDRTVRDILHGAGIDVHGGGYRPPPR